jgi:hypothetical protein
MTAPFRPLAAPSKLEPVPAAPNSEAHKAKIKTLASITGAKVAAAVAAHLDDAGVAALIASLRGMPLDRRERQIAELTTWSAKAHREEKP